MTSRQVRQAKLSMARRAAWHAGVKLTVNEQSTDGQIEEFLKYAWAMWDVHKRRIMRKAGQLSHDTRSAAEIDRSITTKPNKPTRTRETRPRRRTVTRTAAARSGDPEPPLDACPGCGTAFAAASRQRYCSKRCGANHRRRDNAEQAALVRYRAGVIDALRRDELDPWEALLLAVFPEPNVLKLLVAAA